MFRRYKYRSFRPKGVKYSNETIAFNTQVTNTIDSNLTFPATQDPETHGLTIVPPTNVLGNRKVKNFTIKITANANDDQIFGALVYVPEGTFASSMQVGGTSQSIYEPNQNVICTFIIPPNCSRNTQGTITQISAPTQIVVSTRLARNLNTGDSIALIFSTPNGLTAIDSAPVTISGTCNFAIKY